MKRWSEGKREKEREIGIEAERRKEIKRERDRD